MCTLRLSIDINLVAFTLHLQLKPPVEFVRKKLDNAIEIMCTYMPLHGNPDVFKVGQMEQRVCDVVASLPDREKRHSSRGGLNSIRPQLCSEKFSFLVTGIFQCFVSNH